MRNQWRESYNAQRRRKEIEEEKKEVKEGQEEEVRHHDVSEFIKSTQKENTLDLDKFGRTVVALINLVLDDFSEFGICVINQIRQQVFGFFFFLYEGGMREWPTNQLATSWRIRAELSRFLRTCDKSVLKNHDDYITTNLNSYFKFFGTSDSFLFEES